jgi:hypothetical protein
MRTLFRTVLVIVAIGVVCAVLSLFGMNPFKVVVWIGEWIYWLIASISDFLVHNSAFRDTVTSTPGSIRG